MATKKQKREEALARRERFLAMERQIGLNALARARRERDRENREAWQKQHDEKHSWKKRISECPLCMDVLQQAAGR